MMQKHFSLKDAARVLKLKPYQIDHALAVGSVPEPALRVSNRRVFRQEDLKRLAKHFGVSIHEQEPEIAANKAAGETL
jgi:hypothetical protein